MNKKIIVALDLDNISKALRIVKELKEEVYAFKIGHEFFYNFGITGYKKIYNISPKIFLDLKLHDIPNTVLKGLKAILITDNPWFYISLVAMIIGTQLFLAGFLGELLVKAKSNEKHYVIKEKLNL